MDSLKLSVFTLAMSLSMSVLAADTTDNTKGSDRNLNSNNPNDLIRMQDCLGKNGNNKILCESEMQNDKTRSMNNENSRLNQSRNRKMRDDIKSKDIKSEDMKSEDMKSKDMKSEDMKSDDMKSKDMQSKDTKPNGSNSINPNSQPNNSNSSLGQ